MRKRNRNAEYLMQKAKCKRQNFDVFLSFRIPHSTFLACCCWPAAWRIAEYLMQKAKCKRQNYDVFLSFRIPHSAFRILGLLLLACGLAGCGDRPTLAAPDAAEKRQSATLRQQLEEIQGVAGAPEVPVLRLRPQAISEQLSITGELVPRNAVIVKPLMDGRITFLRPIKVGDMVRKGEVIAKIDDRDIEDDINDQQKQIAIAKEKINLDQQSLVQDQRDLEFDSQLVKEGYMNKHELEKTQLTIEQAKISLRQNQISLEQETNKLNKALRQREKVPIVAPISGMVVLASHLSSEEKTSDLLNEEILSLEGQLVGTASPIFGIVSQDGYLAQCQANGRDKAKLSVGQQARVTVITHRPITVAGKITKISLLQDAKTHAYKVWISLDGKDPTFTSGLFVRAYIQLARRADTLVVKKEYVKERNNRQFVQVVQGGAVKDRWVTTGLAQDDRIELETGVKAGEMLVASKEVFAAEQTVHPAEVQEEPAEGETAEQKVIAPEAGVLPIVYKPMELAQPRTLTFTLDEIATGTQANLQVKALGPLNVRNLRITMNGEKRQPKLLATPEKIVHEGGVASTAYDVPANVLVKGKNWVTIQFNGETYNLSSNISITTVGLTLKRNPERD